MQILESIEISRSKDKVWATITDIEKSAEWVSNIVGVEIMEQPKNGMVGLKWKETRKFCGKEVSEIMWVIDAVENDYYSTRAESHGSVYISRVSLKNSSDVTTLTMSFFADPQTLLAKFLSKIMGSFIVKSLKKELRKDLNDIKNHVEQNS